MYYNVQLDARSDENPSTMCLVYLLLLFTPCVFCEDEDNVTLPQGTFVVFYSS